MRFWPAAWSRPACRSSRPGARPSVEVLESRLAPYAASGNAWAHAQLITLSFVPDGTVMALGNGGNLTSNLFSAFDKIPGVTSASQWQNLILKAAQQWAQQTNINFALVNDDGEAAGSGAYQQGNPNFGDVRIGGYAFGSGCNWLASTFYPPSVNNYSVAGDTAFNTSYGYNVGSTYDLFTVAMHEVGHELGLACSNSSSAVMYGTYSGVFTGLGSDDIAGVRSIYSNGQARSHDAYNSNGHSNGSFAAAANITPTINPNSLTSVVTGLDITTTSQAEYFTFTAPGNSDDTMTVTAQSTGLSLLTPKVTVYNASHTAIGSATFKLAPGAVENGATLTLSNLAVTPGATYYVAVQGLDKTAFSIGAYALTLNLGTGANPTAPRPNTQTANGNPYSSGGGTPMEPATHPSSGVAGLLSPLQAILNLVTGVASGLLGGLLGGGRAQAGPATAVPGSGNTDPPPTVPQQNPTNAIVPAASAGGSEVSLSVAATDLLFATLTPQPGSSPSVGGINLLPALAVGPTLSL